MSTAGMRSRSRSIPGRSPDRPSLGETRRVRTGLRAEATDKPAMGPDPGEVGGVVTRLGRGHHVRVSTKSLIWWWFRAADRQDLLLLESRV
jgi:hypothetical protein